MGLICLYSLCSTPALVCGSSSEGRELSALSVKVRSLLLLTLFLFCLFLSFQPFSVFVLLVFLGGEVKGGFFRRCLLSPVMATSYVLPVVLFPFIVFLFFCNCIIVFVLCVSGKVK